ncbi:NAD(P)-dependent dehydrogenase (short-subunit alcohol dehydrogenase family) [Natronocella acetinitrilica]|uniref:NAD(P)-dependent dehydrogenase (Short-subunit alcohol dehydrogenase family) n=1 Tax=Natronocella acetinitrilica TaxID=414046 RepID=A0AAE3G104_9GAMM|nr:SDR family oxidoreductase [Natronocella acetinitrilica]MCP1673636.1 NAD(P)-dependent dehydrogenase (short-subunit alcohol dehydrogenase family) [Natronocella acetinitrilica]
MSSAQDPLFDITGRSVQIAGGGAGLGRAIAEAFASRGAHCTIADLNASAARAVADSLPGQGHHACHLDVADPDSCEAAVAEAVAANGRLDVLINSAGRFHVAPALDMDPAAFRSVMDINTCGAFNIAQAAGRVMVPAGAGRIITLSSVSSRVANPQYAAYASSKGALTQLTRVLALEWAPHQVTVNAIGPALTLTDLTRRYLADSGNEQYALDCIPMGRFGRPEDIIGTLILLASEAGAFITGQTFHVDGGRTLS